MAVMGEREFPDLSDILPIAMFSMDFEIVPINFRLAETPAQFLFQWWPDRFVLNPLSGDNI
jgi:hypothetical protein